LSALTTDIFRRSVTLLLIMAKPIKETPVIKGNDAKVFRENMTKTEANKVTSSQMAQMQANYTKLMSISGKVN
jgi:hypothetical protein